MAQAGTTVLDVRMVREKATVEETTDKVSQRSGIDPCNEVRQKAPLFQRGFLTMRSGKRSLQDFPSNRLTYFAGFLMLHP